MMEEEGKRERDIRRQTAESTKLKEVSFSGKKTTISRQVTSPSCQKSWFVMFQKEILLLLSFSFVLWVTGRSYLHLGELERVLPASPGGPLNAICIGGVLTAQVLAIKVGGVAVAVPPGAMVEGGAVVLRVVIIPVFGGELHPVVFQQRVT